MIRGLAVVFTLAACAPEPEPDPTFSFAVEVEPHLLACATCHAGATPDGALDLSGGLYDALVEAPSGQSPLLLVEPGDSRASYVWHKLGGTQGLAGGSGTRMPLGDPLPDEVIDAVAEWIDRGAAP